MGDWLTTATPPRPNAVPGAVKAGAPPADATAFPGFGQWFRGQGQGGIGALIGQLFGARDGTARFDHGGMTPSPLAELLSKVFPSAATATKAAGGGLSKPAPGIQHPAGSGPPPGRGVRPT